MMPNFINIRKLNDVGITEFQKYIDKARNGEHVHPPFHLITDPDKSTNSSLIVGIDIEKNFSNRYDFGVYLWEKIKSSWDENLRNDCGMWTWIALAYFKQFCPPRGPNRQEHYILSVGNWSASKIHDYSYRHCALTPVRLIKDFKEAATFFLRGTENRPSGMETMGDPVEQLFSRQYVMRNEKFIKMLQLLYQDNASGRIKTGAMSEPKKKRLASGNWSDVGKGGVRRLIMDVLPRLNLTYNMAEIEPNISIRYCGEEFLKSKFYSA